MEKKFKENQLLVLTRSVTICCTLYPAGTIVKCKRDEGNGTRCFVNKSEEMRGRWYPELPKRLLRPLEATEKFYAARRWDETRISGLASVL